MTTEELIERFKKKLPDLTSERSCRYVSSRAALGMVTMPDGQLAAVILEVTTDDEDLEWAEEVLGGS